MSSPNKINELQITENDFANLTDEKREAILELSEHKTQWKSCLGGATDSRLLKYTVIHTIIFLLLIWCMVMLTLVDSCEATQMYSSMLTFLVGLVIPATK